MAGAALAALTSVDTAHAGFTVLHSFGGKNDGASPTARLKDLEGNFYGTTFTGGRTGCDGGCGTVFKLTRDGTETVLYAFTGGSDGALPWGGLIRDSAGKLYGTTQWGGETSCNNGTGCGTVFKLATDGAETVLHAFTGGSDGFFPDGGLTRDSVGNLYGVTVYGGGNSCASGAGCGTVFKLAADGTETVLHAFGAGSDGAYPSSGLIKDTAGNIYGTTEEGGTYGYGIVFELAPDGTETVLYSFAGGSDGANPVGSVIIDSGGNIYGTTSEGGGTGCEGEGCGTVFKLATDGTETVIHAFTGGSDGAYPSGDLIKDSAGNLFGTTANGGTSCNGYGCGTVFKLATDGTETVLHTFNSSGGSDPEGGLIKDPTNNLYGTTFLGGKRDRGIVFKLKK